MLRLATLPKNEGRDEAAQRSASERGSRPVVSEDDAGDAADQERERQDESHPHPEFAIGSLSSEVTLEDGYLTLIHLPAMGPLILKGLDESRAESR